MIQAYIGDNSKVDEKQGACCLISKYFVDMLRNQDSLPPFYRGEFFHSFDKDNQCEFCLAGHKAAYGDGYDTSKGGCPAKNIFCKKTSATAPVPPGAGAQREGGIMLRFLAYFLIAMVLSTGTNAFAGDKNTVDKFIALRYKGFRTVENVGYISVLLEGSAEEIGLNKEELTGYLRLRFKNSFAGIAFKELAGDGYWPGVEKAKKIGIIEVRVWTVGNDYPIAYHVKIESGNFAKPRIFEDEFLGYGSKQNVPDSVRDAITQLIDVLAISFFKARDEL